MKIENKYVKIKNGRSYDFRNTIINDYLKLFNKSQYDNDYKKLSATEKELIYCYIKTDRSITQTRSGESTTVQAYYNLLNLYDIENPSEYCSVSNDWVHYANGNIGVQDDINFADTGYVENGKDYKLLFAIKDLYTTSMTITIGNIEIFYWNRPALEMEIFEIRDAESPISYAIIEKQDGVYYFAIHLHNVQNTSDLFNLNIDAEGGLSVDFQYSIIKETNNEDYAEQINASSYEYSPFIDTSDLAGQYNYRLPVVNDYAKGQDVVEINYVYNNVSGYAKSDGTTFNQITNINDIANQKLLQLAFGNDDTIYAFVDVASCNITMLENESLYIYRKDTLSSDAKYTGDYYPAHLSPLGVKIGDYIYYGELYSIGFGFSKGIINEEYLISENPVTEIDDYTYQVELQRGYDETLTPHENLYPNSNLYSVYEVHEQGVYPSSVIYPNSNLYPESSDYKYLIYKYRLYRISDNDIIESEYYYTMSYYTEHKGQIYMNTKLERS